MLVGIVAESVAGTDVSVPTYPIGNSPITVMLVKAIPAGEVTVTDNGWPGFSTLPAVGEEICNGGWFCCAEELTLTARQRISPTSVVEGLSNGLRLAEILIVHPLFLCS